MHLCWSGWKEVFTRKPKQVSFNIMMVRRGEQDSKLSSKRINVDPRSGAALGKNTSTTLDHLLYESGYNRWEKKKSAFRFRVLEPLNISLASVLKFKRSDKRTLYMAFLIHVNPRRMRPDYIGDPVVVYVNLEIKWGISDQLIPRLQYQSQCGMKRVWQLQSSPGRWVQLMIAKRLTHLMPILDNPGQTSG